MNNVKHDAPVRFRDLAKQGEYAVLQSLSNVATRTWGVRVDAVKAFWSKIGGHYDRWTGWCAPAPTLRGLQIRATDGLVNVYLAGLRQDRLSGQAFTRWQFGDRKSHRYTMTR